MTVQNPECKETVDELLRLEKKNNLKFITNKRRATDTYIIRLCDTKEKLRVLREDLGLISKNLSKSKIDLILTKKMHSQIIFLDILLIQFRV